MQDLVAGVRSDCFCGRLDLDRILLADMDDMP